MSIYTFFNIEPDSHPFDIENALKSKLREINQRNVSKYWTKCGGNEKDIKLTRGVNIR